MSRFQRMLQPALVMLLILSSGLWIGCTKKEKKTRTKRVIPVKVGVVSQRLVKEVLRFSGDVEGTSQVQIFSPISDRLLKITVKEGQRVKKNQILGVVEHTRLRQAENQVRSQYASTRTQKASAFVKLAAAKVSRDSNLRELRRLRRLYKRGAGSSQQVDLAQVRYRGSISQVQAAALQIKALDSQLRALRASVAQAATMRRKATLRAPFEGIIGRVYKQVGDMVMPQFPLFQLAAMDNVKVKIQVPEKDLRKVRLGGRAEIQVAAWNKRIFVGKITKIAPTLDLDTRTAPAEITIPNLYPGKIACKTNADCGGDTICMGLACTERFPLRPGMIAKVKVVVREFPQAIVIPLSAILNNSFGYDALKSEDNLAVYVLGADGQPKRRKITLGLQVTNNLVQITSGLRSGEKLLVSGHNMYKAGDKLRLISDTTP